MNEVLENINYEDALLVTAPPGWGKTYKLLEAIKMTGRKVIFIFPLRALCDEVAISAYKKGISTLNLRSQKDCELINGGGYQLILTTPEIILGKELDGYIYILDEFHLFYYWGDSFREKMQSLYLEITSFSHPIIFLTATLSSDLKDRLETELNLNYQNIYQIDMGNQKLKNYPKQIYYYPKYYKNWIYDEIFFDKKKDCTLVFCRYREEVRALTKQLHGRGFKVLSCVGGEAKEFMLALQDSPRLDFIVATSVVSHGVNLPKIGKVVFHGNVENMDFYLQMVGRGGRDGSAFTIHTLDNHYFSKYQLFKGFLNIMKKRTRIKLNKLIYYAYEL